MTKAKPFSISELSWSEVEKFWRKVKPMQNGCWHWTGENANGYGRFSRPGKPRVMTHRLSFLLRGNSIPEDRVIDHKCRNRICCNPSHLRLLAGAENTLIGIGASAQNARKTHCKRGHALVGENINTTSGGRRCNECLKQWYRDKRAKVKAQKLSAKEPSA